METEVVVGLIALVGVLVSAVVQWLIAKSTVRSEANRLHRQLNAEFQLQQFSEWQTRFQSALAEFLAVTDPEINPSFDKTKIVPLTLKIQLMLNLSISAHSKVNGLVNQLSLAVCGWSETHDAALLLRIHAQLLDAARDVLFLPAHPTSRPSNTLLD